MKISKLNEEFRKADSVDTDFFAEYRTFSNLYAGNHYVNNTKAFKRMAAQEEKGKHRVKVTRNHTNVIIKYQANSILTLSPDVMIQPNNPRETSDIKAAEMNQTVWEDWKNKTLFSKKLRQLVFDFCIFGEAWVFPYWDEKGGQYLGEQQVRDERTGEISVEQKFSGEVKLRRIMAYDVRRDSSAQDIDEAAWIGYKELRLKKELLDELPKELHNIILSGNKGDSFTAFDHSSGKYVDTDKSIEVNHVFYRPNAEYPKGYYCSFVPSGKLYELKELPLGMFPILTAGMDELPSCARHTSMLKQGKTYQAHINFLISQKVKHMLTLGDDKLIVQAGTQVTNGEELAGIRAIKVNGPAPTILNGRTGGQYTEDLVQTIDEYYRAMMVQDLAKKKETGQFDAYAVMYSSAKEKAEYAIYAQKIEEFLTQICDAVLRLKKAHLSDEALIKITGQSEYINIPEFKRSSDLSYSIKLKPSSNSPESVVGKSLELNTILQYGGQALTNDQIGLFIAEMPHLNNDKIKQRITQAYERSNNLILQLDRGEMPNVQPNDPHVDSLIESLYARVSEPEFPFLNPQVQQNYQQVLSMYENVKAEQLAKLQAQEQGFIPTDGPQVSIDGVYEEVIGASGQVKSQRIKMPQSSLRWLQETLQNRNQVTSELQNMPKSLQAQIAEKLVLQNEQANQPQQNPQQPPQQ